MDAHVNFAESNVATAPSPAISGTSLVVTAGTGTRFPAAPFYAVVAPVNTKPTLANAEIVRVSAVVVDTLTITRAMSNTTAKAIAVGDQIYQGVLAEDFPDPPTYTGLTVNGIFILSSTSATALTIGSNGATNPTLTVDTSAAFTGLNIKGNASGSGVTLTALGGASESIILVPKGVSGRVKIGDGSASTIAGLNLNGGSNSGFGSLVSFARAGVTKGYVGTDSAINGTTSDNLTLYTTAALFVYTNDSSTVKLTLTTGGLLGIGAGTGTPTHVLDIGPTSGATAGLTARVGDLTPSTGVTGIFFNAGANQGVNPILTVAGTTLVSSLAINSDRAGISGTVSLTTTSNATITNAYVVAGGQAATTQNSTWLKVYMGTQVAWIPVWINATP